MTREEIKDFCDMKAQLEPENEDIFKTIVKILEQEPFINKTCVSSEVCEHDKQKALDKIRAEISALKSNHINDCYDDGFQGCRTNVLHILDKYKADKKPTCGNCKEWGTVNCTETYREPTENDDICDSFKAESEE